MIPLSLTLKAFGPFRDEQTVDFTVLAAQGLFMVSGPTGSGKTTVFDAITFALYGEASGELRRSDQFKSDYATLEEECSVTFRFRIGSKEFTVTRKPKQPYSTRRGTVSVKSTYAELTLPDGTTIVGVNEVNAAVQTVMGLTRDQFKKIIMLPQGEFRKLLNAGSDEKQEIFRKLFSTDLYYRFTQLLQNQSRALQQEYHDAKLTCRSIIQSISPVENSPLSTQITASEPDFHAIYKALQLETDTIKAKKIVQERRITELERSSSYINLDLFASINEKFNHLKVAQERVRTLSEQSEAMDLKGDFLTSLTKARDANGIYARLQDVKRYHQAENQRLAALCRNIEEADGNLINARRSARAAQKELEHLPELEAEANLLRVRLQIYAQLKQAKQELSSSQKKASDTEQALKVIYKTSEYLQQQAAVEQERAASEAIAQFQRDLLAEQAAQETYQQCRSDYMNGFQSFLDAQASFLADGLKKGKPCPVCGSIEHPHPAHKTSEAVTQQQLDQLKQSYDESLEHLNRLHTACSLSFQAVADRFPGYTADTCMEIPPLFLESAASRQTKKLETLEWETQRILQESSIASHTSLPTPEETEEQRQYLLQRKAELEAEVRLHQENAIDLQAKLPESTTPKQFQSQLDDLEQRIKNLRQQAQQAQQGLERITVQYDALQNQKKGAEERRTQYLADEAQLTGQWDALLRTPPAMEPEEFQTLLPLLSKIPELEDELHRYDSEMAQARQRVDSLSEELRGMEPYPLDELKQQKEQLDTELAAIRKELTRLNTLFENHLAAQEKLRINLEAMQQADEAFRTIDDLYRLSSGNNPQRLSLERYVHSIYFDEIITRANLRLSTMTNERYTLVRRTEKEKGLKASGLELDIFDAYTGKARHVNTLSGGESFQCALCLALGLSDSIEENAGGIRIDTLFIDEGFGSLDAQSLDAAIECILSLRESGRTVGIISHVEELKERIPTQLRIHPSFTGSTAEVLVP